MSNGICTRESFREIDNIPVKLDMLFDTVVSVKETHEEALQDISNRLQTLESRRSTSNGFIIKFLMKLITIFRV